MQVLETGESMNALEEKIEDVERGGEVARLMMGSKRGV